MSICNVFDLLHVIMHYKVGARQKKTMTLCDKLQLCEKASKSMLYVHTGLFCNV